MSKQLNINLNFSANAEQAKAQIESLKASLNSLTANTAAKPLPITNEVIKAQDEVMHLKKALNDAFNVNTGKFDLSRFNDSLKNSGTSLTQVRQSMQSLGVEGQQNFMKLTQSIMQAEVPLGRTNRLLSSLGTTLKNTVKWQLSSSMLHGFMSAVSSAYGYAQDLNKSLNNIRIVTGQSAEQMEKFAIKANNAAKSLSASTLEYTDAALIYYQQGLDDKEVEERTNATVKMATVTGQSAQKVSDQMTAIWNNFDDGSKSLEYYADAITALGAKTASSSDEIAQGLEKFAAVADTVGLSYEYATSALATVVAETRQAPEVVGTAFKTILARIQGLKLGETLEDGTDLNKYSEALMSVGVQIKDANGDLKSADMILQETAEKWKTLGKDSQVALAQTVGGMRQYNQFISIMDNWDGIEANKMIAETSEGTLTEQQEIYAESWEGASERVKAALEDIYQDLLKDDFFIGILNGIEKILSFVDNLIESIGGAKGVVLALGSVLLNVFAGQAAKGLENIVYNFKSFVGLAKTETMSTKQQAYNEFQTMVTETKGAPMTNEAEMTVKGMEKQLELENQLLQKKELLSAEEQEAARFLLEQNQAYADQLVLAGQRVDQTTKNQTDEREKVFDILSSENSSYVAEETIQKADNIMAEGMGIEDDFLKQTQLFEQGKISLQQYQEELQRLSEKAGTIDGLDELKKDVDALNQSLSDPNLSLDNQKTNIENTKTRLKVHTDQAAEKELNKAAKNVKVEELPEGKKRIKINTNETSKQMEKYTKTIRENHQAIKNRDTAEQNFEKTSKHTSKQLDNLSNSTKKWSSTLVKGAQSAMSLSMAITSFSNIPSIFKNDDLTAGQKLLQLMTSLGMAIPMLINGLTGLNTTFGITAGYQTGLVAATEAYTLAQLAAGKAVTAEQLVEKTGMSLDAAQLLLSKAKVQNLIEETYAREGNLASLTAEKVAKLSGISVDQAAQVLDLLRNKTKADGTKYTLLEAMAEAGLTTAKGGSTIATIAQTVANWALNASMSPLLLITLLLVAAIGALVAIVWIAVKAFQAWQENSLEGRMEAAREKTKELGDQLQNTQEAAKSLKEEFNKYDTIVTALKSCTKGTEEWYQKLREANQVALEILQKYPSLYNLENSLGDSAVSRTSEGLIKIEEWAYDEIYDNLEQAIINLTFSKTATGQELRDLAFEKDKTDFEEEMISDMVKNGRSEFEVGYLRLTRIASDISEDAEKLAYMSDAELDTWVHKQVKDYVGEGEYSYSMEDAYYAAMDEYAQGMNELAATLEENTAAMLMENQLLSSQVLAENQQIKQSGYLDEFEAGLSGKLYKQAYDTALENLSDEGLTTEEKFQRYSAAAGIGEATFVEEDGEKITYADATGEEKTVSLKTMEAAIAAADATGLLEDSALQLINTFQALEESGKAADQAFKSFLSSGNFGDATQKNFEDFEKDVKKEAEAHSTYTDDNVWTREEAEAYLDNNYGDGEDGTISDETAQKYGYDTAQEWADALAKQMNLAKTAWDDLSAGYSDSVATVVDNMVDKGKLQDMALSQAETIGNSLQKAYEIGGSKGMAKMETFINELDPQDVDDFATVLDEIDWSSVTPTELAEKLQDAGVQTSFANEELEEMIRLQGQGTQSIDDITAQISDLNSVAQDLNIGDTISEEDFNKLGSGFENYFTKMSDGTYKLTADAETFYQAVMDKSRKDLTSNIEKLKQDNSAIDNLINNYDRESIQKSAYSSDGVNSTQANAQLDYLKVGGYEDTAKLQEWKEAVEQGTATKAQIEEITAAVEKSTLSWDGLTDAQKRNAEEITNSQQAYLQTAATVAELDRLAIELSEQGSYSSSAYQEALIGLAAEYDNCTKEIEKYNNAIRSGNTELIAAAEEELKLSTMIGEASEKYDLNAEVVETQAKQIKKLNPEMELSAEQAAQMAVNNQRMNKGIKTLNENFEDWNKTLKTADKTSGDYAEAMVDCTSAIADLVGASEDLELPDEFFNTENLALLERAANGDTDAINQLGAAVAAETVKMLEFDSAMATMLEEMEKFNGQNIEVKLLDEQQFNKDKELVLAGINDIKNGVIGAGGAMDAEWVAALNRMALTTGMSVEEMNGLLGSLGVQAKVETTYVEQPMEVPTFIEHVVPQTPVTVTQGEDADGNPNKVTYTPVKKYSVPGEPMKVKGFAAVAQISTEDNPLTAKIETNTAGGDSTPAAATYSGNRGAVSPSSTSSGSGDDNSSSSESKKTKKSDVVERYKEITDQLDDVTRATDKASKAADRLYGPARLKAMKDVSKSLKDELGLLEQKSKEVAKNYAEDQFYLNSVSKSAGLNFEYDEAGNITNYSGEMTKLYEQLRQAEASGDEDAIDLAEEKIDTITSAIEQYDETRELWEDVADEMDEKFYEWQDNNAAIFEYELEIKIDATEFENKFLEFEKDWFADDAYSFAESVAATGQLLQNSEQNLQSYSQSFNELQQLFAEGKISQAAFMEQLQNLSDGALEEFGNIIEYDKEMMEAYGTQLELNSEELAKYTDRLDHLNSVLEHYNNLLDLTGQSQNYDAKGKVLATQEKNAANIYEINKAYFDDKQAEADALKAQLDAALASGNEGAAELYQKQWEDADVAAREAQENMLSSAESWAEAIKATLENKLAGLADTLADALTGGKGFDQLNTELERLEATQEEFLTTTNKIYETNKLINTAQKEIDKTSNTVAKQKLKAFQQETSQLQNQGELSQFELDVQQKKYDLLLAEIALEEAQNAKSVVRLQRDSEGNFGYVYTADEQKTADAEQSVADAENALYNTQLEGANKYAAQRQELIQAMYDEMTAFTEAYHNGEIQSEAEYEALMQETQAYYYDRLADNSRLYKVATSEDSRIVQEAWSSNLSIMSIDGQEFEKAVDQYMIDTKEHLQEFENKMDNLAEQVGIDANSLDDSLGKVEKASEDLKNEVVNKLLPAQQQNLDKINLLTSAYAANRKNTDLLKTAYGQLATAMGTAYTNASNLETQLRNTNQAAQLIGGTGWVQWDYSTGSGNENSGDPGGGKDNDDNLTTTPRSTAKTYKKADYARQGNKTYVKLNNGYWFSENDLIYQGNDVYSIKSGSYGGNLGLYGLEKIKQFDTGGYTGEWGSSEGKLAFVHEKELILNKEDTKNFLEAIKLLKGQYRDGEITIEEFGYLSKELESAIQNSVNAQRAMLASCLEYAEKQSKSTLSFNNKLNDTLEQHVTIEAVFPNVEDRYEIEEAFMNLTNEASQYINRKNN